VKHRQKNPEKLKIPVFPAVFSSVDFLRFFPVKPFHHSPARTGSAGRKTGLTVG
jgi:hypothetical protein